MIDLILPLAGGTLALAGGGAIVLLRPTRHVALLAGASLLLLGMQLLGWARAIDAISWGERNYWLDLSFVCALPVSLVWLLLSVTLGRGDGPDRFRGWRVYLPIQTLLALAAVAGLHWFRPLGRSLIGTNDRALPVTALGGCVSVLILLHATLTTANFESTYLAFSARWQRAFRPALLSIVISAACCGYVIASSVLLGRLSLRLASIASITVGIVSIALPLSLVRTRVAEASVTAPLRPLHETASFVLGVLLLGVLIVLVQLMRLTGWTLARTAWISIFCATLGGLAAVAISSSLQRFLKRLIGPYLHTSRFDPEVVWSRLSHDLDAARTPSDVLEIISAKTAEIARVEPVTLFVREQAGGDYVVAGSTLQPAPRERVGDQEPLARGLRASHHAIDLRGRADDLGLIPIYVENAKQISACEAACAVPLLCRGNLLGFLLCGSPEKGSASPAATLLQLEVIVQMVTARLISLERGE